MTAEPTSQDPGSGGHASPLRVVALGVALLAILVLAGSLARPRGGPLDADEVLGEFFEGTPVALAGFEAPTAQRLPGGERVVTYPGVEGGSFDELVLFEVPRSRASAVLKAQFQGLRFDSAGGGMGGMGGGMGGGPPRGGGRGGPPGGGHRGGGMGPPRPKLQDISTLPWHGYEATYARLRHRPPAPAGGGPSDAGGPPDSPVDGVAGAPDPTPAAEPDASPREAGPKGGAPAAGPFYDVARVNLSAGDRCLIAYVRFPLDQPGDRDAVADLLAAFRPAADPASDAPR